MYVNTMSSGLHDTVQTGLNDRALSMKSVSGWNFCFISKLHLPDLQDCKKVCLTVINRLVAVLLCHMIDGFWYFSSKLVALFIYAKKASNQNIIT